jgi:CRISPR-associated endonuclease Cas3-HD
MRYVARFDKSGKEQTLVNHLTGVSTKILGLIDNDVYGEIIGILHDIGKYSGAFQEYIRSDSDENKPDHSSAGAQWILALLCNRAEQIGDEEINRIAKLIARMISHCVVGHHSGLLNGTTVGEGTSLDHRLTKTVNPYLDNIAPEISEKVTHLVNVLLSEENLNYVCRWIDSDGNMSGRDAYSLQFAIRMLFSSLVDADRLDSEQVGNPEQWKTRIAIKKDALPVLLKKIEDHLRTLPSNGIVNKVRKEVSEQCKNAASNEPGFFDLTVPTGGGKTFASLRFALHHAINHEMRRVIYVMPYTTIIDQNADEFRKVLDRDSGTTNVLEHHSNLLSLLLRRKGRHAILGDYVGTMGLLDDNADRFVSCTKIMVPSRYISKNDEAREFCPTLMDILSAAGIKSEKKPRLVWDREVVEVIVAGRSLPADLCRLVLQKAIKDKHLERSGKKRSEYLALLAISAGCARHYLTAITRKEGYGMGLDVKIRDAGYLVGRLFALCENIQKKGRNWGPTLSDKLFSGAIDMPRQTLVQLYKNCLCYDMHKADNEWFAEVFSKVKLKDSDGGQGEVLPENGVDQFAFMLGYWHQRSELRPPVKKVVNNDNNVESQTKE